MFCSPGSIGRYGGFANGGGQIWLDNVQCSGDEDRLIDCMASPLGTHNCVHNEDAGVYCLPPIGQDTQSYSSITHFSLSPHTEPFCSFI